MVEVFAPLESACGETAACAAAIVKSDKAAAKAARVFIVSILFMSWRCVSVGIIHLISFNDISIAI